MQLCLHLFIRLLQTIPNSRTENNLCCVLAFFLEKFSLQPTLAPDRFFSNVSSKPEVQKIPFLSHPPGCRDHSILLERARSVKDLVCQRLFKTGEMLILFSGTYFSYERDYGKFSSVSMYIHSAIISDLEQ